MYLFWSTLLDLGVLLAVTSVKFNFTTHYTTTSTTVLGLKKLKFDYSTFWLPASCSLLCLGKISG